MIATLYEYMTSITCSPLIKVWFSPLVLFLYSSMNPIFSDQSENRMQNLNILARQISTSWSSFCNEMTCLMIFYTHSHTLYIRAVAQTVHIASLELLRVWNLCGILKVTIERLQFHIQSSSLTFDDDGTDLFIFCVYMVEWIMHTF